MGKHIVAQISDQALAQPVDKIIARCGRNGQDRSDRNHHEKIFIDEGGIVRRKSQINHAPRTKGYGKGCQRGGHKCNQRRDHNTAIARQIGREHSQGFQVTPFFTLDRLLASLRRTKIGRRVSFTV